MPLQLPKHRRKKKVDSDNPPWSEEMLGPPVLRLGRRAKTRGSFGARKSRGVFKRR
jgi:hypothetical protein